MVQMVSATLTESSTTMVANNNKAAAPKAGNNSKGHEAWLKACEAKVTELGRVAKAGSTAKEDMIRFYQEECVAGRATPQDAKLFANWYNNGRKGSGKGMAAKSLDTFASSLAAFADDRVIKNWSAISATLTKLHDAGDKAVSRTKTGMDKFGQSYAIAKKIRAMPANAKVLINEDYVKQAVQPAPKEKSAIVELARKAIKEQTANYFAADGNELTPAQTKTRDAFFKLLGIV